MSYLIFGIVIMLVTWGITLYPHKKELKKYGKLHIDSIFNLLEKNTALLKQIEELKSELITQKAMKESKN